jgi:hypothetical protein
VPVLPYDLAEAMIRLIPILKVEPEVGESLCQCLNPSRAPELMQYARQKNFRPLGIVMLAENGDFFKFMNEDAIPAEHLDFAKHSFHVHALFWCFCFPSAPDQDAQS